MNITPELKKRIITGIVGGALLLGLILFGGLVGMFFLTTVLSLGMMWEFAEITLTMSDKVEKKYVLLSLAWFTSLFNLLAPQAEFALLISGFIVLFIYFLVSARKHAE